MCELPIHQRKEALEQRRRERENADQFLRKPTVSPPEPKKQILRKGAGAKRLGIPVKQSPVKAVSPKTDPKVLQARLRAHIKEQRALRKNADEERTVVVLDNQKGLDWQTARQMAAQGLDNLLHGLLPEDPACTPQQHGEEEEAGKEEAATSPGAASLVPPAQDLESLLREMGPPKYSSGAAAAAAAARPPPLAQVEPPTWQQPEAGISSSDVHAGPPVQENRPMEEGGGQEDAEAVPVRRGVTTCARHRPPPQEIPRSPGVEAAEAHLEAGTMPEWAKLVGSLESTTGRGASGSLDRQQAWALPQEMPGWARLVPPTDSLASGATAGTATSFAFPAAASAQPTSGSAIVCARVETPAQASPMP